MRVQPTPAPVPLAWSVALVASAGFLLRLAFPAPALWICAPLGIAVWLVAIRGRGFWMGSLLSLVGGLTFWLTLIQWLTLYLGPLPWFALAGLMAIYMALGGGAIAFVWSWVPRIWPGALARLLLIPALIASLWVAREALASSWPYGGFSWGRIAMSQTNSPLASWFGYVGAGGVSWLVVAVVAFCLQYFSQRTTLDPAPLRVGFALPAITLIVALIALPHWPLSSHGSQRVLAVQGGADASLFTNLPPGAVLSAQTQATMAFAGETADVVVWPENGSDLNPLRYRQSAAVLDAVSREFSAPLVVGTISERNGEWFNSSLVWEYPSGVTDWYDKMHPVPFAEYMPDRTFWRPFAPDLIDLIGRDYQAGTRPNVMQVAGVNAGVAICFDIAYDDQIRQMVQRGAQIIYAQTNNADFGTTDESDQQLAIARMRSLETGISVVNISTVGRSAIIGQDGQTLQSLPTWQPGGMLQNVPLAASPTLANIIGYSLSYVMNAFAWVLLIVIVFLGPLRRKPNS